MSKSYRKADNCGPVPYPGDPRKLLQEGDVVSGDEWEPLAVLGYVVPVEDGSGSVAEPAPAPEPELESKPKKKAKVKAKPAPEPTPEPEPAKAEEVSDGMREAVERGGAEAVDSPKAGESGGEGVSG